MLNRVYCVYVPLAGVDQWYPLARTTDPAIVGELVRILCLARSDDGVSLKVETQLTEVNLSHA